MALVLLVLTSIFYFSQATFAQPFNDCGRNPFPGSPCPGGALYAGFFQSAHYMVTPPGCTDSARPVCVGLTDTLLKAWNNQADNIQLVVPGLNLIPTAEVPSPAFQRGAFATNVLINSSQIAPDSAAHYCANMNFGGYADWVLPSKSEAAYLYCVASDGPTNLHNELAPAEARDCVGYNGKRRLVPGFVSEVYWTSTPMNNILFWAQEMMTGSQYSLSRNSRAYVRCVRRFQLL